MKIANRSRQWDSTAAIQRLRVWSGSKTSPNEKYAQVETGKAGKVAVLKEIEDITRTPQKPKG